MVQEMGSTTVDAGVGLWTYVENQATTATDPSGNAIVTATKNQADAVRERIRVLTTVTINEPRQLPNGFWILDPVGKNDPRWGIIGNHVMNNDAAGRRNEIDPATRINRHLLETGAQFDSGVNVYVADGSEAILAGHDGRLRIYVLV